MHVVAYEIAPYQNGMVAIMIPQIRFSDRPLTCITVAVSRLRSASGANRLHREVSHRAGSVSPETLGAVWPLGECDCVPSGQVLPGVAQPAASVASHG